MKNDSDHIPAPRNVRENGLSRNWSVSIPIYRTPRVPNCIETVQIPANAAISPVQTDAQPVLLTPHLGTVLESNCLQTTKQVPPQ